MQREYKLFPIGEDWLPAMEFDRHLRDDFSENGWHSNRERKIVPSQRWLNRIVGSPPKSICVFCHKNGEDAATYTSHVIKDRNGKVVCPILRSYSCPICGSTGDKAHTVKHCPVKRQQILRKITMAINK